MPLERLAGANRRSRCLRLATVPLLLASCLYCQSTNPVELLKQPTPPANERILYGKDSLQFGEIRVPVGAGPFPVAIMVHGGCWSAKLGDLPEAVTSFELLRPIASALVEAGIASWNIEYRRLGNEGGGWPGTYLDISHATDLLRNIATRYHLDLNRAIAIGHSSGGQLAMWLAAREKLPKNSILRTDSPLSLKGVIDIDGPPDLETFRASEQSMCGGPVVTQFVGGTPGDFPNRYREGSVTGLLPTGVRQELFIRAKPVQLSELLDLYVGAAEKAGDPIRKFALKGNHFDGINPRAPDWDSVMDSVRSLLRNP
jgi:acetyl esterase/lipase